jgi:hypothetical protein
VVRRRVVTSVLDLTHRPRLAGEAAFLFDQTSLSPGNSQKLPDPL